MSRWVRRSSPTTYASRSRSRSLWCIRLSADRWKGHIRTPPTCWTESCEDLREAVERGVVGARGLPGEEEGFEVQQLLECLAACLELSCFVREVERGELLLRELVEFVAPRLPCSLFERDGVCLLYTSD